MSKVLRIAPARSEADVPLLPRRLRLGLAELVVAARLAGDLPLPIRTDAHHLDDRLTRRLAGTRASEVREQLTRELARVDDRGPGGAAAALTERGLCDEHGRLDPAVGAALTSLAGSPVTVVLDVSAHRRGGEVRLRSWFGVRRGLVTQLTTGEQLDVELAWFDPRLWVSQVARAAQVEPWVPDTAPLTLPDYVSLPSELLAGNAKAHRDHRTDLLPALAASSAGQVRLGRPRELHEADSEEILALLRTFGTACRGRLRLLAARRDR
ncbi:hypothetical protein, partial [Nocardioides sp.]|uniref:hypothetical protein n=1 Tax=Nocardioides sp. TaxID=35761 RepID=UPI002ED2FC75